MVDNVSLLIAFYLWAKRRSLLVLSVGMLGGRVISSLHLKERTAFAFKDHRSCIDQQLSTWNWGVVPSLYVLPNISLWG
jgi:hypothetical protein